MNWMRVLGVPFAGLAMLAVAACGGDDEDDGDDTGGDSAPTATASAPAEGTTAPTTPPTTAATQPPAASGAIKVADIGALGAVLTNADGRTLYIFTNDTAGKSVCNDSCATAWPPVLADAAPTVAGATGEFSLVTRDDGRKQVAFNGKPLYTYAGDQKAGDATGEGVGGVWFAAKASGTTSQAPGTPTGSTSVSTGDPYGY